MVSAFLVGGGGERDNFVAAGVKGSDTAAYGTALAGVDYAAASGVLIIPAGQLAGSVNVNIWGGIGDSEPDETFFINLSNATGGVLTDTQSEVTIGNDDNVWTPVLKSAVVEGGPGLSNTMISSSGSSAGTVGNW